MILHDRLQRIAQEQGDIETQDEEHEQMNPTDARCQLAVLRRVLTGGIMTGSRNAVHRRQTQPVTCACGLDQDTIDHVNCSCPLHEQSRTALLQLPDRGRGMLRCTSDAGIITTSMNWTTEQIIALHVFSLKR